MKEDKPNLHWTLKYLPFFVIVAITLFLFYDISTTPPCINSCSGLGLSMIQKFAQYTEIIMVLSVVMVAIYLVLKLHTRNILFFMIVILLIWLSMAIWDVFLGAPCPAACYFPAGLTCISSKIDTTGGLILIIGQGSGTDINITGVECINTKTPNPSTPTIIEPLNKSILIRSGGYAQIVGGDTNNKIYCKNEDDSIPPAGSIGCLNIYINYTNMVTGQSNITHGHIGRYE